MSKRPLPDKCTLIRAVVLSTALTGCLSLAVTEDSAAKAIPETAQVVIPAWYISSVQDIEYSPDNSLMATGARSAEIGIWEAKTGRMITVLRGHTGPVTDVTFSPDGKFLLSSSEDKTVRLWNIESGETVVTFNDHAEPVVNSCFSPDMKHIASAGRNEKIIIRDAVSGRIINSFPHKNASPVYFTPDSAAILCGEGKDVILKDFITGEIVRTLTGQQEEIGLMRISPDGKYCASAGFKDTSIRIWELATGALYRTLQWQFPEHVGYCFKSICFSADSTVFVFSNKDRMIKVINMKTGEQVWENSSEVDILTSLACSPDNKNIVAGGLRGGMTFWDLATGKRVPVYSDNLIRLSWDAALINDDMMVFSGENGNSTGTMGLTQSSTGTLTRSAATAIEHIDFVTKTAISPDGKYCASIGRDNTIMIREMKAGSFPKKIPAHNNSIEDLAYSPDSRYLATGGRDKTAKLWDVGTGALIRTFPLESGWVDNVIFSADGQNLIIFDSNANIQIRDLRTGKAVKTFDLGSWTWRSFLAVASYSRFLAAASHQYIVLIDLETGEVTELHRGEINDETASLLFSSDGRYLVSCRTNGTIMTWEIATCALFKTIPGNIIVVLAVYTLKDKKHAIIGCSGNEIKFLELETGTRLVTLIPYLIGGKDAAWACYAPDGTFQASENVIPLVYFKNGLKLFPNTPGLQARYYHKGLMEQVLADFSNRDIRPEKPGPDNGDAPCELVLERGNAPAVNCTAFSNDGKLLAFGDDGNQIHILDVLSGEETVLLKGHLQPLRSLAFSPDGKTLLSSSGDKRSSSEADDNTVKLWDLTKGELIRSMKGHRLKVNTVCFSPDGKNAASASQDDSVIVWDLASGSAIATLIGHETSLEALCYSPDGRYIASGCLDGRIVIWDGITHNKVRVIEEDFYNIFALCFSPDNSLLAAAGVNGEIYLFNTRTWQKTAVLRKHHNWITGLSFSHDGCFLVSSSTDTTVRVWSVLQRKELFVGKGHTDEVNSVSLSPDSKYFVSGGKDGNLCFWNTATGALMLTAVLLTLPDRNREWVFHTPDGQFSAQPTALPMIHFVKGLEVKKVDAEIRAKYLRENLFSETLGEIRNAAESMRDKKTESGDAHNEIDAEKTIRILKPALRPDKLLEFGIENGFARGTIAFGMPLDVFVTLFPESDSLSVYQIDQEYVAIISDDDIDICFHFTSRNGNNVSILVDISLYKAGPDCMIGFNADFFHPDQEVLKAYGVLDLSLQTEKFRQRKEDYYLYPDAKNPQALIVLQYKRKGEWLENTRIYAPESSQFQKHMRFRKEFQGKTVTYDEYHDYK